MKMDIMLSLDSHPFIRFIFFLVPHCCKKMIDIELPTHKHLSVSQVVFVIYALFPNTLVLGLTGSTYQYK